MGRTKPPSRTKSTKSKGMGTFKRKMKDIIKASKPTKTDEPQPNQSHQEEVKEDMDLLKQTLHLAARDGDVKTVAWLLSEVPSLFGALDKKDRTVLHSAAGAGREKVVAYLLAVNPRLLERVDEDGYTALHSAALCGHEKVIARLLAVASPELINAQDYHNDKAALHLAISQGFDKVVALLLPHNNKTEPTPHAGNLLLHLAAETGRDTVVPLLLAAMPNLITTVDENEMNALHVACCWGHDKVVAQLLAARPTLIDETDFLGKTALGFAARQGSEVVVAQLMAASPSLISRREHYGVTPLHGAKSAQIASLLLAANPALIHAVDKFGSTVLHSAIRASHYSAAERFLELKPELISAVDKLRGTPLHVMSCRGILSIANDADEETVSNAKQARLFFEKLLHLYPEALRVPNEKGFTPLRDAYDRRARAMIALLLPHHCLDELVAAEWFPRQELKQLMDTHCVCFLLESLIPDVVGVVCEFIIGTTTTAVVPRTTATNLS